MDPGQVVYARLRTQEHMDGNTSGIGWQQREQVIQAPEQCPVLPRQTGGGGGPVCCLYCFGMDWPGMDEPMAPVTLAPAQQMQSPA